MKVRRGSTALTTVFASRSVPSSSITPVARPFLVTTWSTGDSSLISAPNDFGGPGQDLGEAAVATLVERPGAISAVVLAERVIEEDETGALGTGPDFGADDSRRSVQTLHEVGLEVVLQDVCGASCHQPDHVVQDARG